MENAVGTPLAASAEIEYLHSRTYAGPSQYIRGQVFQMSRLAGQAERLIFGVAKGIADWNHSLLLRLCAELEPIAVRGAWEPGHSIR